MHQSKILMISGYPPWHPNVGGGDIIAYKLSEALEKNGLDITFIAVADNSLRKDVSWGNFKYISEGEDISSLSLELEDFDIIHIHNSIVLDFKTYRKIRKGRRCIVGLYTPLAHWFPRSIDEIFYTYLCKDADMVISLSEFSKKNIAGAYGINPDKIRVMHAGVDEKFFDPDRVPRFSNSSVEKLIKLLFAGRLNGKQQKGVDILLRSIPIILKEQNVTLDIVGTGPRLEQYQALSRKLGLEKSVTFRGFIPHDQMPERYLNADLFVFPSRRESFGLVLAEAMAAGLPVVSTSVGAIPEVVGDGKTGMLVLPDDPEKFARAVNFLLDDPELMKKMGLAGKQKVR
jgi:glycosyltransferase involved in cell wall biosynthesis